MDDLERLKFFLDLAKTNEDGVKNRQQIQWKLSFGLWGGLAAFTAFAVNFHSLFGTAFPFWVGIVYFVVFVVSLVFWYFPLHRGHATDRARKHFYMDKIDAAFGYQRDVDPLEENAKSLVKRWKSLRHFSLTTLLWFFGETSFTLLFMVISWLVIHSVIK